MVENNLPQLELPVIIEDCCTMNFTWIKYLKRMTKFPRSSKDVFEENE